jgi:hypothetical protein
MPRGIWDVEPDDGLDLGPDERDRDLLDGSWESAYYGGRRRTRDWRAVQLGIALLIVMAIVIPSVLVFSR